MSNKNKIEIVPTYTLMIVSPQDLPVFYFSFSNNKIIATSQLDHLIINSALDFIENRLNSTPFCYLGKIDQYLNKSVYAYLLYSGYRLLLVVEPDSVIKLEEQVKTFFMKVHERILSKILNPLPYWKDDALVRDVARYLQNFNPTRDNN